MGGDFFAQKKTSQKIETQLSYIANPRSNANIWNIRWTMKLLRFSLFSSIYYLNASTPQPIFRYYTESIATIGSFEANGEKITFARNT